MIGRPNERLGEEVIAFVQLEDGCEPDPEALRSHCRANLAAYKVPAEIRFVDGFPRTAMGKILKKDLRW